METSTKKKKAISEGEKEGGTWNGVEQGIHDQVQEGQERCLDGHENDWKSEIDGVEEVGASPGQDRDLG